MYGARLTVENTFRRPIQITWSLNKYVKNYFTDNSKSYTIQPGTKKDILLQLRFERPISEDDLKSLVVLTSTYKDNQNMVLLNEEEKLLAEAIPMRREMEPMSIVVIQPSLPRSRFSRI